MERIKSYKNYVRVQKNIHKTYYYMDQMLMFYMDKNQTAIFPIEYYNCDGCCFDWYNYNWKNPPSLSENENSILYSEDIVSSYKLYFGGMYRVDLVNMDIPSFYFTNTQKAFDEFYKLGGSFMEYKKSVFTFQKLYNKFLSEHLNNEKS